MSELWHWYLSAALLAIGMPGTFQPIGKTDGRLVPLHTRADDGHCHHPANNVFGLVGAPLLTLVIASQGWRFAYGIIAAGLGDRRHSRVVRDPGTVRLAEKRKQQRSRTCRLQRQNPWSREVNAYRGLWAR